MGTVREAIAELGVDGTKLPGDLARADREFEKAGKRFGRKVGAGLRRGLNKVGNLAGLGVGFGFGQGLRDAQEFDDQMQRLGSQARLTGAQTDEFAAAINRTSNATGISRRQLAGALDEMVNLEGGTALTTTNLETLQTAMLATGSDGRELAQVMFTLGQNMDISQDAMRRVVGGMDRIGAEASIPFSQLASSYVEVAAAASSFGDKGPEAVFATVAAMQAMRREIPTADEVKTSFTNLANEIVKKRKILKRKFKIDVTDSEGNALSLIETFDKLKAADLSDSDIADIFGKRAAKGLRALLNNFEAYQDLQEKGARGAQEDFLGLRAMERAESSAGRTAKAYNRFKQALAEPFTGENLESIATALEGIAGLISKSISGWGRLMNLFNEDSRDRKLIDDTSTGGKLEAAGMAAADILGIANNVTDDREGSLWGIGDIQPWERPHIRRRVEDGFTGVNSVLDSTRRNEPTLLEQDAQATQPASVNFEIDYRRMAKEIGRETAKEVGKIVQGPGATAPSHRSEPAQ